MNEKITEKNENQNLQITKYYTASCTIPTTSTQNTNVSNYISTKDVLLITDKK